MIACAHGGAQLHAAAPLDPLDELLAAQLPAGLAQDRRIKWTKDAVLAAIDDQGGEP